MLLKMQYYRARITKFIGVLGQTLFCSMLTFDHYTCMPANNGQRILVTCLWITPFHQCYHFNLTFDL